MLLPRLREIINLLLPRLPEPPVPPLVLCVHLHGYEQREHCTQHGHPEQRPEAGPVQRGVGVWEKVAGCDAHGGTEGLVEADCTGLYRTRCG